MVLVERRTTVRCAFTQPDHFSITQLPRYIASNFLMTQLLAGQNAFRGEYCVPRHPSGVVDLQYGAACVQGVVGVVEKEQRREPGTHTR